MSSHNEKSTERVIVEALEYLEAGKTPAEIFELFPEHQKELEGVFSTVSFIKKEGKKIYPDKEFFRQVMGRIPTNVTHVTRSRYSPVEGMQGLHSWMSINNLKKISSIMNINWKIVAPLGVVAVVALVVVSSNRVGSGLPKIDPVATTEEVQDTPIEVSQELPVASPQPATSDTDEAISTILAAALAEDSYFADAMKDGELIVADSQSINSFGQSYYENEL